MKRLLNSLKGLIFPSGAHCLCCGCGSRGELICAECAEELSAVRLPAETGDTRSVWRHADAARQLVIGLKHENLADCAQVLADGMAEVIEEMDLPPETVLTWVTMPETRRRERGIDHGCLLCEAIAVRTGMPMRQLLTRTGRIHTQEGLSGAERQRNLHGTLICTEKVDTPVLLIDDVMTTGATARACRETLMRQGAPQVFVLTATRA